MLGAGNFPNFSEKNLVPGNEVLECRPLPGAVVENHLAFFNYFSVFTLSRIILNITCIMIWKKDSINTKNLGIERRMKAI